MYSEYVVDIKLFNKSGDEIGKINDETCLVLLDETVYQLLKKISYKLNSSPELMYIYTKDNYNILINGNINSPNILKEILEETTLSSSGVNMDLMLMDIFGIVKSLDLYVIFIQDEMKNLMNFYSINLNTKLINHIYNNYIAFYYPLLNFNLFSDIIKNPVELDVNLFSDTYKYIESEQVEILQMEKVDKTDVRFLDDPDLSNLFLVIYPEFECSFDFEMMKNNIIFLNDMFLILFNSINDKSISSCTLVTPQTIIQKGIVEKEAKKGFIYKIIYKGIIENNKQTIKYTVEFELKRCKIYLAYNNSKIDRINDENVRLTIDTIIGFLNNDFVKIKYTKFIIDFFNIKIALIKNIDINRIIETIPSYDKYFFIFKRSVNSVYIKYKMGKMSRSKQILYSKIYNLLQAKISITKSVIDKLKEESGLDEDEIIDIINEIKTNVNVAFKQKGIGISITSSYIIVTGINSVNIYYRLVYLINKLLNLSLKGFDVTDKVSKKHVIDEKFQDYVTFLDKYLKRSKSKKKAYWCKACQNYGNKVRKPVLLEHIPPDFIYDEATNTFINDKGYRIIEIKPGVYFGCDSKKINPNKYIGFIKTCSLCCFKYDQFIDSSVSSKRKLNNCWVENSKSKTKINYTYKYSRIVGDVSEMLPNFQLYFDDDSYLCTLIHIGNFNMKPKINQLIFWDNILINPHMYKKGNRYSIFIYENPFLHKVIYRDTGEDSFIITPIDKYIEYCNHVFNTTIPSNAYNIFFKYGDMITSFSFIKHIIVFNLQNGLVLYIHDTSLKFSTYESMFDKPYVKTVKLPNFKDIVHILKKLNIKYALINTSQKIMAVNFDNNVFAVFKDITVEEFDSHFKFVNKQVDIQLLNYIDENIESITIQMLVDDSIYEEYLYKLFKFNMFIFLNNNLDIKNKLFKLIDDIEVISERYNSIKQILTQIFKTMPTFVNLKGKNNDFELFNELKTVKLNLTTKQLESFILMISNELIYKYASVFTYVSKFVDNIFSYSNEYIFKKMMKDIDASVYVGKIIADQFIQEIYNGDMHVFRALANIYFWAKMKPGEVIQKKNLGYLSKSQTSLALYLKSVITSEPTPLKIVEQFNKQFDFNVSVIFDEIRRNNKSIGAYTIYISIKGNIIQSLSVGFLISSVP